MANIFSFLVALAFLTSSAHAQEVQNIFLSPYPQPDGSLDIEVTWDPPADTHRVAQYQVYLIQGAGEVISAPQRLPSAVSSLRITDVPTSNPFGVSIQVIWKDGYLSHGAFASIDDANSLLPVSPLMASLTVPSSPVGLSREDLGMVLFVILAGAVVGIFSVRLFSRA